MKNLLLGSLCLFLLVGCQTYPKNPNYVDSFGKFQAVNHSVPTELQPFELPPKVEYVENNQLVPKQIIAVPTTEVIPPPTTIVGIQEIKTEAIEEVPNVKN